MRVLTMDSGAAYAPDTAIAASPRHDGLSRGESHPAKMTRSHGEQGGSPGSDPRAEIA
jgi:hypothetical protein